MSNRKCFKHIIFPSRDDKTNDVMSNHRMHRKHVIDSLLFCCRFQDTKRVEGMRQRTNYGKNERESGMKKRQNRVLYLPWAS